MFQKRHFFYNTLVVSQLIVYNKVVLFTSRKMPKNKPGKVNSSQKGKTKEQGEPRRSERANKGIPPPYLQDYVDETGPLLSDPRNPTPMPNSRATLKFSQNLSEISGSKTLTEDEL